MDKPDDVYSSDIYEKEPEGYDPFASVPELVKEFERIKLEMTIEAQKYSDDEQDQGYNVGRYVKIDILEYVDIPFLSGKYEVWMTTHNMESNHAIVEIVLE